MASPYFYLVLSTETKVLTIKNFCFLCTKLLFSIYKTKVLSSLNFCFFIQKTFSQYISPYPLILVSSFNIPSNITPLYVKRNKNIYKTRIYQ